MRRFYCSDCNQEKLPEHVVICLTLGHYVVRYFLQRVVVRGRGNLRYIPI
jgi:hypothetical protein